GGRVECLLIRRLPMAPGPASAEDVTVRPAPHSELDRADVGPQSEFSLTEAGPQSELGGSQIGVQSDFGRSQAGLTSDSECWEALMHPGQKLKPGARVMFDGPRTLRGEVLERHFFGRRIVRLWTDDGYDVSADARSGRRIERRPHRAGHGEHRLVHLSGFRLQDYRGSSDEFSSPAFVSADARLGVRWA